MTSISRSNSRVMMIVFLLFASLQISTRATNHIVNWIVPPSGAVFYTTWAANKIFLVGDNLVFTFTTGAHDVAVVSKDPYDSCNAQNASDTRTNGPATIKLNSTGTWYFICSIPGHCDGGQKLAVAVNVSGSPAPVLPPTASASPPVSTPNATPPEGSSLTPSGTVMPPSTTTLPPASTTLPSSPASPSPVAAPGPATPSAASSAHSVGAAAALASVLAAFLF